MSALQWASVALGLVAYGSFVVFLACCVSVDRSGLGRVVAAYGGICAVGAVVFWWL